MAENFGSHLLILPVLSVTPGYDKLIKALCHEKGTPILNWSPFIVLRNLF